MHHAVIMATKNLASDSSPNMRMGVLREGLLGKMHQRAGNSPGAVREASQVKISDAKLMLQNTGDGRLVRSAMAVGGGSHKRSHILKVIKWDACGCVCASLDPFPYCLKEGISLLLW